MPTFSGPITKPTRSSARFLSNCLATATSCWPRAALHRSPLARLDSANELEAIDETDLCFTDQELSEFAALRGTARQGHHGRRPRLAGVG